MTSLKPLSFIFNYIKSELLLFTFVLTDVIVVLVVCLAFRNIEYAHSIRWLNIKKNLDVLENRRVDCYRTLTRLIRSTEELPLIYKL